jgi:hypothetical protein
MCIAAQNKQICTSIHKCNGVTFANEFMDGCVHCAIDCRGFECYAYLGTEKDMDECMMRANQSGSPEPNRSLMY